MYEQIVSLPIGFTFMIWNFDVVINFYKRTRGSGITKDFIHFIALLLLPFSNKKFDHCQFFLTSKRYVCKSYNLF